MAEKSELLRIPVFADVPDDQLDWFLSQCQEEFLKPGDTYVQQGDPAAAKSHSAASDNQAAQPPRSRSGPRC